MCDGPKIIVFQQLLWVERLVKLRSKELKIPSGQELYCFGCYVTATEHLGIEQNIYCDDQGKPL